MTKSDSVRYLGQWEFEGGGYVKIISGDGISTEEALDMVDILVRLKREELKVTPPPTPHDGED